MNARSILIVSLGLNLVVAGWAVARWQRTSGPGGPSQSASCSLSVSEAKSFPVWRVQRTNVLEVVTNRVDAPGFHWSQIETNDYEAYAANLRAVGGPEHVVRQMLMAEIEEHYADRRADAENYSNFWETESQRDARQLESLREQRRLDIEKRALLARILGVTWSVKAFDEYVREEEAAIILGCLSDDAALRLMDAGMRVDPEKDLFRAETKRVVIDIDEPRLEALIVELRRGMEQAVSPAEAEELLLRLADLVSGFSGFLSDDHRFSGVSLNGDELRRIAAICARHEDLVDLMLRHELDPSRNGPDLDDLIGRFPASALPEIRQLIGPERSAALERSMDKDFREFAQAAREAELPVESAIKAFDIRCAAEAAARELKAIEDLDPAQRNASLKALKRETELALRQVVGEKAMEDFFQADRGWGHSAFATKGTGK
jgi:hypothetical protein